MKRLKDGDMSALKVIYMRYQTMVHAAVRRSSPQLNSADIEELSQDIFLTLVKTADNFDSSKQLKPWLYGISVKVASGFKRGRWLRLKLLKKHHEDNTAIATGHIQGPDKKLIDRDSLIKAFKGLPKEQHEVMVLHAVEGFNGPEIAEILNIEVNTVWTRLHRARKNLSSTLEALERK
jgi:RNA polymerase sigma-70 factor (ECF subfamily)